MPSLGCGPSDIACRRARINAVKAKLKKLGIDPRTNKYSTLYFRWMKC